MPPKEKKASVTPSITLTAAELSNLVAPVIPLASKDMTLPLLASVVIETRLSAVTALATDRYRLGLQRVYPEVAPEPGFRAVVPLRSLAQIRQAFKSSRHSNPVVTLTVEGDTLVAEAVGAMVTMLSARIVVPLEMGEYPNLVSSLLVPAITGDAIPVTEQRFNPTYLGDFAAAQRFGQGMHLSVPAKEGAPWLVQVGDDFIGLIQGVRFSADTSGRAEARTGWGSLLDIFTDKKEAA